MNIRCIIVDDKPLAIDILKVYISKISFLDLVYTTQNPLEALQYIHSHPADLIFLDIQMPELNGIQFMKILGGRSNIILTTAYSEYALEGYEHNVVDYLMKPVSFERFYKAVEKVARNMDKMGIKESDKTKDTFKEMENNALFVKTDYKIQAIPLENILFIQARQNYVAIITTMQQIMSLQNIKAMEQKLPATKFMRVHKSYIIALSKINSIEKSHINIGRKVIPIGDSYRTTFFERIKT